MAHTGTLKRLIKQSFNTIGLEIRRLQPPPPPKPAPARWQPPDPTLLPDFHLYDPRYSPWTATEGEFHELFEQIRPYTIVTRDRCYLLRALARQARGCAGGEFWECGVYKGGTAMLLAKELAGGGAGGAGGGGGSATTPPILRLFDTFEGLPDADPKRDFHKRGEFGDTSQADVTARVRAAAIGGGGGGGAAGDRGVSVNRDAAAVNSGGGGGRAVGESAGDNGVAADEDRGGSGGTTADSSAADFIRIHAGFIPATFAGLDDSRVAFAHVDVDLYGSVLDCCRFIYPRLTAGGVMIFDDYGFRSCPGARKAVDEYFADKPEVVLVLPTGQAMVTALPCSR
jgi:hypothetical protein